MPSSVKDFNPLRTSFYGDYSESNETTSGLFPTSAQDDPLVTLTSAASVVPTECLSQKRPSACLQSWKLVASHTKLEKVTANHIIGAVIEIPRGRTSPIAAIDPLTRRIRTLSGSIYELGMPDGVFYFNAPDVMKCLGF